MGALTVQLGDPAAVDLAVSGGKAAGLAELVRAGFSVPDGFVLTTAAYRLVVGALPAPLTLADRGLTYASLRVGSGRLMRYLKTLPPAMRDLDGDH